MSNRFLEKITVTKMHWIILLMAVIYIEKILCSSNARENDTFVYTSIESTTQAVSSIRVWMDSVMFQHLLRWEGESSVWNYTVYLKSRVDEKWEPISSCSSVNETFCDLTDELHTFISYDIKVNAENSDREQFSNVIQFCAEYQTKILPPSYKLSRMAGVIFFRPITDKHKNLEELVPYQYQVKYWPKQSRSDEKMLSFDGYNSEDGIKDLNPSWAYCLTARYYEPIYVKYNLTSGSSEWGDILCVNATSSIDDITDTSKRGIVKWIIATTSIILLVVTCLGCKICSTYMKIKRHDEVLPDYLNTIEKEMKETDCDITESSLSVCEKIDRIDLENSYVILDPQSTIHQSIVGEDWLYPMHDETDLDLIQRGRFDENSDESTSTTLSPPSSGKNPRSRIRSRGYHSFSSDDITSDDVTTLAYDTYVDMEYANTNDLLIAGHKNTILRPISTTSNRPQPTNSSQFQPKEPPAGSGYLNMRRPGKSNSIQLSTLTRKDAENTAKLQHAGQVPYENITYCSKLYGNIPDAFVCSHNVNTFKI